MSGIKLDGELVEIGSLEDECGAAGMVIRRADQSFVTIKGLTIDECREMAPLFMESVGVSVGVAP